METKAMPPEIAKAVVSVMGKIRMLGKDNRNEHGRYNYTSVDKFYEFVGPLMSEAGIFVLIDEKESEIAMRESVDSYGKVKSSAWLAIDYDVSLFHESGAVYGPIRRSIQVLASGPQAYASGVSFVEKYFLRSLFKIPTGDQDDVDASAPEPLPAKSRKAPEPRPELLDMKSSGIARDDMLESLAEAAGTRESLLRWAQENSATKARLMPADAQVIADAFSKAQAALKQIRDAAE